MLMKGNGTVTEGNGLRVAKLNVPEPVVGGKGK